MTYEEFARKRKSEPAFSLFKNAEDTREKLSSENNLRIDWIARCTDNGTIIEQTFLDETFRNLLDELRQYLLESPEIGVLLGGFRVFLLYLPEEKREKYDGQLVSFFTEIVSGDFDKERNPDYPLSFDTIFGFIVSWSSYRPQFLVDVHLGVDPREYGALGAFLIRRRLDIVKYRDSDYSSMKKIANYMLYMYELLIKGKDGRSIIDEVKAKNYLLSFLRDVLVSAQNNGYDEEKKQIEAIIKKTEGKEDEELARNSIFISHRHTEAKVAEMLKDFLVACGIPNEKIFCSSLPGNDVKEKISPEVKRHLREAAVIFLILSSQFYKSAYCLNEAGIAWYLEDVLVIPIGLPETNQGNMYGFLNGDYILRRLSNDTDMTTIYDLVKNRIGGQDKDATHIINETKKLSERYHQYISNREPATEDITDDDKKTAKHIVEIREKVEKAIVNKSWVKTNEDRMELLRNRGKQFRCNNVILKNPLVPKPDINNGLIITEPYDFSDEGIILIVPRGDMRKKIKTKKRGEIEVNVYSELLFRDILEVEQHGSQNYPQPTLFCRFHGKHPFYRDVYTDPETGFQVEEDTADKL